MTRLVWPVIFGVVLIAATWITEHRCADRALARKTCLFGAIGGIIGARIWYWAQYGWGSSGMSAWGFWTGAVIVVILYRRRHPGPWQEPDAIAAASLLGAALVRVGCFIHGCCYGKPSELPWAVAYGPSTPAYSGQLKQGIINGFAPSSLPVHPTQLYEAVFLTALCAVILLKGRDLRLPRHGLFLLAAILYAIFRFVIEFLRGDAGGRHLGPLTFAQATSLVVLVPALVLLLWRSRAEQGSRSALVPPGPQGLDPARRN